MDYLCNYKNINNTCPICLLDLSINDELYHSSYNITKNDSEYYFGCSCNISFHYFCIDEWCDTRLCCPKCFIVFKETTISKIKKLIKNATRYALWHCFFTIIYFGIIVVALSYYIYLMLTIK